MQFQKGNPGGPGRPVKYKQYSNESENRHNYKLHSCFGISKYDYDEMYKKQDGKCAICGKKETIIKCGKIQQLSVDHDHSTGRIRGLLCFHCNSGIGKFGDNSELLRKAADYLDNKKETGCLIQMVLVDS